MPEFKTHNLWPVPVYESDIPVKQEWKDAVINLEYERTHVDNSDISKDRYILNKLPDLKSDIEHHCELFVRKYLTVNNKAQFYLQNSWCNIHGPNESSQIHYHGNSLLSGVYYPILPKDSGDIGFHKGNIYTESMAAGAGGVTSFMEMPNTIPNAVTNKELEKKYLIGKNTSFGNYSFYLKTMIQANGRKLHF